MIFSQLPRERTRLFRPRRRRPKPEAPNSPAMTLGTPLMRPPGRAVNEPVDRGQRVIFPPLAFAASTKQLSSLRVALHQPIDKGAVMPAAGVSSSEVPPIIPRCPTCDEKMMFLSVSPTCRSVIYGFWCENDGDRLTWEVHRSDILEGAVTAHEPSVP